MQPFAVPAISPDPGVPGARGLFGPDGVEAVAGFLAKRRWSLDEARPVQVLYRPGRSCLVRYRAKALNAHGQRRIVTLCAEARAEHTDPRPPAPELEARYGLADPVEVAGDYLVWAFPYDPSLRHLPDAAWGETVKKHLAEAGEQTLAVDAHPVRYRPRRRAVFRYVGLRGPGNGRLVTYGKVMRTLKADRVRSLALSLRDRKSSIHRPRHHDVALSLPLPNERGPLLFAPIEGRSLRDLLLKGDDLPSPERVVRLIGDLPDVVAPEMVARHPRDLKAIARSTGRTAMTLAPSVAHEIRTIVEAIESEGPGPHTVVHGDLYEAQVFVDSGYRLGLIDLDDVGPGDAAMDAANFCAHLIALALAVPAAEPQLLAYRELAREAFLHGLDIPSTSLARREALALMMLATGPFRVMSPRWPAEVAHRIRLAAQLLG